MAGLSGILYLDGKNRNNTKQELSMMLDKISYRGLYKKHIVEITGAANGFVGLVSNYDTKDKGDKYHIFLDGKIYNLDYLLDKYCVGEVEKDLSDTGKIELLFEKISVDIFREFEGPFVLVIIDKEGNLFIARDFLGIKPLYLSLIHISEPTRRTPISYAVFCLKK